MLGTCGWIWLPPDRPTARLARCSAPIWGEKYLARVPTTRIGREQWLGDSAIPIEREGGALLFQYAHKFIMRLELHDTFSSQLLVKPTNLINAGATWSPWDVHFLKFWNCPSSPYFAVRLRSSLCIFSMIDATNPISLEPSQLTKTMLMRLNNVVFYEISYAG